MGPSVILTNEQREALQHGEALRVTDPESQLECVVVRADVFERVRQLLIDDSGVLLRHNSNRFDITNLGAILFARSLAEFPRLSRKALRVVIYRGSNRVETIKEQSGGRGYAAGFEGAVKYINDQLPQNEQIGQALRHEVRMYPELAIRELVANALIHQDFWITGAGPMVEIFADRMEITNPGTPLIDPLRFIDEPPRSRNETMAALMRRLSICEERGSGIDKVITQVELFQLPPPDFRVTQSSTIAVLLGPRDFQKMDRAERIRACYQHACLWFVREANDERVAPPAAGDQGFELPGRVQGHSGHSGGWLDQGSFKRQRIQKGRKLCAILGLDGSCSAM